MSDVTDAFKNYVPNPNYGDGVFRRRIRLEGKPGQVIGALEDNFHGFQVTVSYQDGVVTQIEPGFPRIPFTTCTSADEPLKALLGCDIDQSAKALNGIADPYVNCTHLLDLTLLCIAHIKRGDCIRQYDVLIPDRVDEVTDLTVHLDGEVIHHWRAAGMTICSPEELLGEVLGRGFAQWADQRFEGDKNEAAFILQKGCFVSQGRYVDLNAMAGNTAVSEGVPARCHTFSPSFVDKAIRHADTARDFTNTPEQLLKFT